MLTEIEQKQFTVLKDAFECEDVRPIAAWCDETHLNVQLADNRKISTPLWWYPFLDKAEQGDRLQSELEPSGIWWPSLDEGVSVKGLLLGWKAPNAIDPKVTKCSDGSDDDLFLSIGVPLTADEQKSENQYLEGATCSVDAADYRSLIHQRICQVYEHGRRYLKEFDYDRFFAATDSLLDVGNIIYRARTARWPRDETTGYLWMYGALQALIVEQDATYQLMNCFKIGKRKPQEDSLRQIRDLRVSAVGHPSEHKSTNIKGCTYLGHRDFSSRSKFKIVTLREFDKSVIQTVDVLDLIDTQRSELKEYLRSVWCLIKDDPIYDTPVSFSFGDSPKMANELLALAIAGIKTATCGALRDYPPGSKEMPVVGRRDVIMDGDGWSGAVIETLEVTIRRFDEVDEAFAHDEGEGCRTLADWRQGHQAYFERNGGFSPDMELVCERFRLVEVLNGEKRAQL
jgi:uncharacterized protein YhfF